MAGFDWVKFVSNSHEILKEISPGILSPKVVNLDQDEKPIKRALYISWDLNSDMLNFKIVNKNIREIKRGILSLVSLILDPIGLMSPIIEKAQLEQIWRRSLGWDKELSRVSTDQWNLWNNSTSKLSSLTV